MGHVRTVIRGRLRVGTSGWRYPHWRNALYPPGLPQNRWLEHYSARFDTVESNAAFYRLPTPETFRRWGEQTPPDFVMAVKASRYLTHIRRLSSPEEPVARLLRSASALGDKLGPVLLQLPPTLRADAGLLARCLRCFPRDVRVAVEPRHPSWWTNEIHDLLAAHGTALCWADRRSRPATPLWRTANWVYLRCHEGAARPRPSYGEAALHAWVRRTSEVTAEGGDVYVYFNNDAGAAAVRDASRFAELASPRRAPSVPAAREPRERGR